MSAAWNYGRIGAGRVRTADGTAEARRYVRTFWMRCDYSRGTPAEKYFVRRGLPWLVDCDQIRFRAECPHPSGTPCSAVVALILDASGNVAGLHRTFIEAHGTKASVVPVKASIGAIAGGAIRIHPACPEMLVAEGVETAASAAEIFGIPTWSAIAAGNLARSMVLPDLVRRVVVAVDNDPPGRVAAYEAALRWRSEGRDVSFAIPPAPHGDFNDALLAGRTDA